MATRLTQAAASAKQLAIASVILLFLFLLARTAWISVVAYIEGSKPTPPPTTNLIYKVLPKLASQRAPLSQGLRIRLNTTTGRAPLANYDKPTVQVYRFQERTNNFNYIINSQRIGTIYSLLTPTGSLTTAKTYTLNDTQNDTQMVIDTEYFHHTYRKNNISLYLPVEKGSTISRDAAISASLTYFQGIGQYILAVTGAAELEPEATFWYQDFSGTKTRVSTQNDANITRVTLKRKEWLTTPIVTESKSDNNIIYEFTQERAVSGGATTGRARLIQADIKYWPIDQNSTVDNALYPIRDTTTAYNDILAGKGIVTTEVRNNATYEIESVYLAYYEPTVYQAYVIPVWVFEGTILGETNSTFQVLVPAIAKGFIAE